MKNKILTYNTIGVRDPKFVRDLTTKNGIRLLRGDIRLDETHNLGKDETALAIISSRIDDVHSLVICSQGGFFDDVKVWSGEDIKSLKAAINTLQNTKQDATSEYLATTEKEIVYAINEVYRGGLRPNAIEIDKLHSSIRETLDKVGMSLKVLPGGTDLTSKTLEDGVWIVAEPSRYTFHPSWFSGNGLALLIVHKEFNNVIMIGHDASSNELPAWASRNLNSTVWRGASKTLEDLFIKQGAGNVTEAFLADGAVTSQKIAEGAIAKTKLSSQLAGFIDLSPFADATGKVLTLPSSFAKLLFGDALALPLTLQVKNLSFSFTKDGINHSKGVHFYAGDQVVGAGATATTIVYFSPGLIAGNSKSRDTDSMSLETLVFQKDDNGNVTVKTSRFGIDIFRYLSTERNSFIHFDTNFKKGQIYKSSIDSRWVILYNGTNLWHLVTHLTTAQVDALYAKVQEKFPSETIDKILRAAYQEIAPQTNVNTTLVDDDISTITAVYFGAHLYFL